MKRIALILIVLGLLPLVQSCDFFRKIAGRPTSAEIETMKMIMEQELDEYRAKLDSIEMENQRIVDSISNIVVAQTMVEKPAATKPAATKPKTSTAYPTVGARPLYNLNTIPHSYYVVVGTFSEIANAEKKLREIEKRGYKGELIAYRDGYTIVGICPSDDLHEANAFLRKIKNGGICREAWIITRR